MNSEPSQKKHSEIWWIVPGILIAALIWYFYPPSSQVVPPQLAHATLLPEAKQIQPFSLEDSNGQPFTEKQLQEGWSFVFFGYTHCPDVCPTTLQTLATSIKHMQSANPELKIPQVVFIGVDPERDSAERLKQFVSYFNADFIGVSGDSEQIQTLSAQLGIIYARVEAGPTSDYLVDHSAAILLFDPEGQFRALFSAPHDSEIIASDFQLIQNYYRLRYQ